jgi:hypothetical protein
MKTLAAAFAAVLACGAQTHAQDAQTGDVVDAIVPPRIELGGGGGVSGTSPDFGALASLPLGDRLSLDVGASYLMRVWRSPAYVLSQAQLRIPFRARLRSRYSLLVGVTHLEAIDPRPGDSPLWREDGVDTFPHAGASLQWPLLGPNADLRVDAQVIVQGGELIPVVPRVVASVIWHANPSPSTRIAGGAR